MPLPAVLWGALTTAARIGSRVALRGGSKIYKGTARIVKNPKKFSKTGYLKAKAQVTALGKDVKRNTIFQSTIIAPHLKNPLKGNKVEGKSFHHLITRPTFGKQNIIEKMKTHPGATMMKREKALNLLNKRKKNRRNYIRGGIYTGIGASSLFGDN